MISLYDYAELREAAVNNPTAENLANLAYWFIHYGDQYWNGESWDADGGIRLLPIWGWSEEEKNYKAVGYELR